MKRTSKFFILAFLYRFAFLLIAAAVQAVIFEGAPVHTVVITYSVNIFLLVLLIICAVLRYRSIGYCAESKSFACEQGVFFRLKDLLRTGNFDSISVTTRLFHRPFKVCKTEIFTAGHKTALYLNRADAKALIKSFTAGLCPAREIFRSDIFGTALFCAGFSNALTGILAAIPLLRSTAELIGERRTEALLSGVDLRGLLKFAGLPPMLEMAANFLLIIWAVGFFAQFLRQFGLRLNVAGDTLYTRRGLLVKRTALFRQSGISALMLSQSLFMCLLRLYSAQVYLAAFERHDKLMLLTPCSRKKYISTLTELRLFSYTEKPSEVIKPPKEALWGYTYLPMTCLALACTLQITVDSLTVHSIHPYFSILLILVLSVWFFFRVQAHKKSALYIRGGNVIINSFKKLSFIKCIIPKEKIRSIKLSESIFQRRLGTCTLRICIHGRRSRCLLIKHIDKEKSAQLLEF